VTVRTRATLALLTLNLLWATIAPVSYLALPLGETRLTAVRFMAAGLAALPFVLRGRRPSWQDVLRCVALGVCGYGIGYVLYLEGVRLAGPSLTALAAAVEPIFTAACAWAFLHEGMGRNAAWSFTLAAAGAWLLAGAPRPGHGGHLFGILLVVLSMCAYGFYNTLGKPVATRVGGLALTGISTLAVGVAFSPWLFVGPAWHAVPASAIWCSVYLGVIPGLAAYSLWFYVVSRAEIAYAAIFLYIQPVGGAVLSWVWLGESMGPVELAGGLLMLLAVFWGTRAERTIAERQMAPESRR